MIVKSAFELVSPVTLSAALPVLEIVTARFAGLPTVTVPKLSEVGDTPIFGAAATAPVPESATCTDGCVASLLAIVSVPDCAPAEVGLNRTISCVDVPGATLRGAAGVTVNSALELVSADTFNAEPPVLETVKESVAELPTVTDPKLSDMGDTPIRGAGAGPWAS